MAAGMQLVLSLLVLLAAVPRGPQPGEALRVLGLFPLPAHSHFMMFKALAEGLAERGHEVVLLSPFPHKSPPANWTDIDSSGGRPSMISTFTFDMVAAPSWSLPGVELYNALMIINERAGNSLCRQVFALPEFAKLLRGGYGRFDVVLTEVFASDCWAVVPYKLGLPTVTVSSAPDVSWMHERIGSVDNPSYINNVFTDFNGPMTLWERFQNTASGLWINYIFKTYMQDAGDEVVREFFGPGVPPVRELVKNTSLILLNRHVSIHQARPVVPNLVPVGGLHIKAPSGKLEASLKAWMDSAPHGVVFFSLGSLIRAATMPAAMRDALLAGFAKLPQRVLWKWEDDGLQVPANVRVAKWLPQLDILAHNKTILFITHGGLMGTLEALHYSVPMLGIPLFADQMSNIQLYMSLGIADRLDSASMTAETVHAKVHGMVSNPKYLERAKEVAQLFRDRPRQAMDEAVWWIEYAVRHRGARHLRPLGADLPLHQYLLLDVAALALAIAAALLLAVLLVARCAWRALCGGAAPNYASKKKRA